MKEEEGRQAQYFTVLFTRLASLLSLLDSLSGPFFYFMSVDLKGSDGYKQESDVF